MKKFAFLFRMNKTVDPAVMAALAPKRIKWFTDLANSNRVADPGNSFQFSPESSTIVKGTKATATGPYTDGDMLVGGYMLVTASSLAEAVAMAETSPIFELGGVIEVREVHERPSA